MWNCLKYFVGMGNNLSLPALRSYFKSFLSCDKSENPKFPQRKDVILLYFGLCYNLTVVQSENKMVDK